MKWKLALALFLVGLAFFTWWQLDTWLSVRSLAIYRDQWEFKALGWGLVWSAWPIALGFAVFAFVFGGFLGGIVGAIATQEDVDQAKKTAKEAQERAHKAEILAEQQAERRLKQKLEDAELREHQAHQKIFEAEEAKREAREAIKIANQGESIAHQKKTRAMAFAERKKRKADKLKARIEAGEKITVQDVEKAL